MPNPIKKFAKSVGKAISTKRPTEQVFGAAAALGSAGAFTAAALLAKARKEHADKVKNSSNVIPVKKQGGSIKNKTKK